MADPVRAKYMITVSEGDDDGLTEFQIELLQAVQRGEAKKLARILDSRDVRTLIKLGYVTTELGEELVLTQEGINLLLCR